MKPQKLFIVRKYVQASSAREALKKEKTQEADDVWIDEKWQQENTIRGFEVK
jgi:hypothetical protein